MSHNERDRRTITRREAIRGIGAVVGAAAVSACEPIIAGEPGPSGDPPAEESPKMSQPSDGRVATMPAVFLPHGGGPWPFMDTSQFGSATMYEKMSAYLKALNMTPPRKPSALLVISAHWEAPVPTVMTAPRPPMLYDYRGFPPETYEVQWPAPGQPEIAAKVRDRLERAGIRAGTDLSRGFDHGTFVPMMLAYPEADVPAFQLSLKQGLDPREHIEIGRALAPLRSEGVFIIGSGMSYHNMRGFFGRVPSMPDDSKAFDDWMAESVSLDASARATRLVEWANAPRARACHPREEHLLPLMVVAGAAEDAPGTTPFRDTIMGAHVSAVHFG